MKKYNGFKSEIMQGFEALPTGGYICDIKAAEVIPTNNGGERLVISFDIADGEHKGYFAKQYKADNREDKKWKGVYNVFLPKGDGSQQDTWAVNRVNNLIGCLEDANPNFHWDWDEKKMKGCKVALVFRREEFQKSDGTYGWTVKPFKVISIGDCKDGKWGKYEDKPYANKPATTQSWAEAAGGDDSDLPWL